MKNVSLDLIDKSENTTLYTISFTDDNMSEFEKFMTKYRSNSELNRDFQVILKVLTKVLENGALERYFRPEGKMKDGVCALPILTGKLRLYCLRISDKILILGNGGIKETKTYQDSPELSGYVMDLQNFEKLLREGEKEGTIVIEESEIKGI